VAIQYIGQATGTTSATLPAHQAGDLLLAFAFRDGSTTPPSLPASGWINIRNDGANTCSGRIAYRIATASGTASGTWSNATSVVFLVYRGIDQTSPIGNTNTSTAVSTTVTYPALSVTNTSWVVGFVGHRSTNVTLSAPSGMTNRASVADATDEAAGHDTNGAVSSWASTNTSVGGSSSGWRSYVIEIKQGPISATATVSPAEATASAATVSVQIIENKIANIATLEAQILAGVLVQSNPDWWSWFFDRDAYILYATGTANYELTGVEAQSQIQEVQAFASINAIAEITGAESESQAQSIQALGGALASVTSQESQSTAETINAQSTVSISVTGTESIIAAQFIGAVGASVIQLNGAEATSEANETFAKADSTAQTNGAQASSEFELVGFSGNGSGETNGSESETQTGNTGFSGSAVIAVDGQEAEIQFGVIAVETESNATIALVGIESDALAEPLQATGTALTESGTVSGSSQIEPVNGTAAALTLVDGVELTATAEPITANGEQNAIAQINGVQVQSAAQPINANGISVALVNGAQAESNAQEVTATGTEAGNAVANVNGVQALITLGTIKVKVSKKRNIGGQTLIRPIQDQDAIAKVKPVLAVALAKKIKAEGITVQNGTAKIIPIESVASFSDVQATGVLDISEDEILLLLAA
jgi:hypothetical protein